jgi:hypothetical protein
MKRTPLSRRYWRSLTGTVPADASPAGQPRARHGYSLARRYLASLLDVPLAPRPRQNPQEETEPAARTARAPSRGAIRPTPRIAAAARPPRRTALVAMAATVAAIGAGATLVAVLHHESSPNLGKGSTPPGSGIGATESAPGAGDVDLTSLTPTAGAFTSSDTAPIENGQLVMSFLAQDIGCVSSGSVTYDIGAVGDFSTLQASLGLDDDARDPAATPTVAIYGDGRFLKSYVAAEAMKPPVTVSLDVADVRNLRIAWSYPASGATAGSACQPVSTLVIGDPVLIATGAS